MTSALRSTRLASNFTKRRSELWQQEPHHLPCFVRGTLMPVVSSARCSDLSFDEIIENCYASCREPHGAQQNDLLLLLYCKVLYILDRTEAYPAGGTLQDIYVIPQASEVDPWSIRLALSSPVTMLASAQAPPWRRVRPGLCALPRQNPR